MDSDHIVYSEFVEALRWADLEYRLAEPHEQMILREPLQKAWDEYLSIRLKLLAPGMICTPKDVAEMQSIRREVTKAANIQSLVNALAKLTRIVLKIVA